MKKKTGILSTIARAARPRVRWYQFSFGSMLAFLTVVCFAAAYWHWLVTTYGRQTAAAEAIGELGGTATSEPVVSKWLRWLPLADRCNKVVAINLQDRDFKQGSLKPLAQLPDLERLYLARSSVSDKDLEYVEKLTKLRRLSLWRTNISNEGLKHLAGLSELRVIDIQANRGMDEQALEYTHCWPQLHLVIFDFTVSERGLAVLASHPNIPVTKLWATRVSDQAVDDLVRLRRLEQLTVELECSRDQAMRLAQLQQLKNLTVLGRLELPLETLPNAIPKLNTVQQQRLMRISFRELADRWADRAQDLVIAGKHPWRTRAFQALPVHVTVTQREPLIVIDAEVRDVTWEDMRRFRKIESITIDGGGFDTAQLAHLEELPRLTQLQLSVPLDAEAFRRIGRLHRLQHLVLSGYRVRQTVLEPDAYDPLGSLTELRTFATVLTRMNDRHFMFVRSCPNLRRVYLKELGITGQTFSHLGELPQLEELLVFNCHQLQNEDMERLRAFKKLRTCWVDSNYIYPSVRDAVLESLPLLENDRSRRGMYRKGVGSKAFEKLPELPQAAGNLSRTVPAPAAAPHP